MDMFKKVSVLVMGISIASSLCACGPAGMQFNENTQNQTDNTNSINGGPGGPACTPNAGAPGGIIGSVYYLSSTCTTSPSSVSDVIKSGTLDKNTYYWGNLDVPTTYYTAGFPDVEGNGLVDNSGNLLTENYAVKFETQIGLSPTDVPGDYEFATISDDGSILQIANSSGTFQTIVNNDGVHPSQFACATQTVHLDSTTELSSQILYYQGPRYYVSMILLWKRIPAGASIDTTNCGESGNNLFFTPATTLGGTATPQAAYAALIADGWTVLNTENFTLPGMPACI